ncbi:hypothetical protein [Microbacterium sp.]|uniref:hypothetical protein n=1 Tax=Microbacterium sp. TaxID=51671 RepID=UPI0039E26471
MAKGLEGTRGRLERYFVPLIAVALVASPNISAGPFPVGQILALLLLPLTLRYITRSRVLLALCGSLILLAISGIVLFSLNPSGGGQDLGVAASALGLLVTSGLPIGVFAWSFVRYGLEATSIAFAVGQLLDFIPTGLVVNDNTWKYSLSYPVCLLLLALSALLRRSLLSIISILVIAVLSIAGSYRSLLVFCAMSLVMWALGSLLRRRRIQIRRVDARPLLFFASAAAVSIIAAFAFTQLVLAGALGSRAQEASASQLQRAGDLLTGGRYEWVATNALFSAHPWGYGPGAVPQPQDVELIHDAFERSKVEPSWQHVNTYMLGSAAPSGPDVDPTRFKLHSTYGDLWVNFGPIATVIFLAVAVFVLIRFCTRGSTTRRYPLLIWFLAAWCVWDLAFSPIYTNFPAVVFTLAILAHVSERRFEYLARKG